MKYVNCESTDIYYNLALEEHIFDNYREDSYLLLWKNDVSVVVGKNQNTYEEINLKEVENKNIKVARRNTGGGTVFHDKGNLNYSFITDYKPNCFSHYDEFIEPVIKSLNKLGVPAVKRNNSDIAIGDMKISGSAQTVKKGRILHHGTLLFDANMSNLHTLLKPTDGIIESKAVKSVRSKVTNIKEYIDDKTFLVADLEKHLLKSLFQEDGMHEIRLSKNELEKIEYLGKEKYDSWEWNYGMSPNFTFKKQSIVEENKISVELAVIKGRIVRCDLRYGDDWEALVKELILTEKLVGQRYSYSLIKDIFRGIVGSKRAENLIDCLF